MAWFKRIKGGITTSTREKKETPEGLWHKCPSCKNIVLSKDHAASNYACEKCSYHERIGSEEYFEILFDEVKYYELFPNLDSADPLHFEDTKKYTDRVIENSKEDRVKGCHPQCTWRSGWRGVGSLLHGFHFHRWLDGFSSGREDCQVH